MKKLVFMFTLLISASFAVAPATYAGSHGHDSKSASDSKSKGDKPGKDDKSHDKGHDKH